MCQRESIMCKKSGRHTARNSFREDRFSEIEDMVGCRRDTKKGDGAGEHKLDPQAASERG
jgi:hypothetical protein